MENAVTLSPVRMTDIIVGVVAIAAAVTLYLLVEKKKKNSMSN